MPDFTRGKWEMKFKYDYDDTPPEYEIFSTFDTKYGVRETTIGYVYEENDARLITAAPNLCDLLSLALSYMYDAYNTSTNNAFKHMVMKDIKRIEALFARIDGSDTDKEEN